MHKMDDYFKYCDWLGKREKCWPIIWQADKFLGEILQVLLLLYDLQVEFFTRKFLFKAEFI